ncbi:MAG: InlB B-repeat-containing protein, partial [Clostridia bacterium]|nr:InlB B-repeat-containing protein [Clostridia bacterium]
MVAFNTMGASGMEAVGVKYNETLVLSNVPELDGYVFKGWTLNGEAYDMNTPVTEDIILVATWYKETNDGKKVVYSNDDVAQNAIKNDFSSEVSSAKETGWDWYYDTDYLFNPSASTMNDANRLWNMATFVTYSTKNGANNISLPAINFTLYSKVDFGVSAAIDTSAGAGLTDIKLNGVSCGGYEYRLISVAEENGKYYATVYKVNETPVFAKVELTDAMAKGQEPLTLTVETNGSAYAWIKISELHMTIKIFDYKAAMAEALAKLPANVEDLTGSEEEGEAALEYMAAAKCMTSAESELYPTPAVVKVGLEAAYVNAIVNAQAGSGAQLAAVEEYRAYIATLTDEEKENSVHKANVEKVNGILKQTVNSEKLLIPNGWWASDEHLGGFKTTYSSTAQKTFDSGSYDGTAVFPAFNFNECQEVYFGLYAVAAAESWDPYNGVIGTITVNGVSFVGIDPQIGDCYFKVTIANGVLTMVNEKDNSVALTVELPEAVLNGTEGLTIEFNFGFWAKAEITEMHVTAFKLSEETFGNTPNGWWSSNEHLSGFETTYSATAQKTFDGGNYDGTAVLPAINYNLCAEVYFGLYAVAAAESWDPYNGVIGTITINGVSFVGVDPQTGDCYFKVTIANGVLTMVNEKNGSVALTVALPEGVLNGTESLTIDFDFGYWAKAEITEMHGCSKIINPATGIINNIPNGWWSSNEHLSGFETTYSATAQKTFDGGNYDGTAILAATNYNLYTEVYFGLYAV